MKHPNQSRLALHAGGDLGPVARWFTDRHLAKCETCRDEVAAYERMREILPDLSGIPEIPWNRMAAEMKANIRLGLAAGECVRSADRGLRDRSLTGWRAAVALASIAALLGTGVVLQKPAPVATISTAVIETADPVQTTSMVRGDSGSVDGIQVGQGARAFRLMNRGAANVAYSVSAQGTMKARYVNSETGQVQINAVYMQ
jgi:ActR/RegA family two-component response regulator